MKIIKYLVVLFILFSFASQNEPTAEIRKRLFSSLKKYLNSINSYDYKNTIIKSVDITSKQFIIDQVELDVSKVNEIKERYSLNDRAFEEIRLAFLGTQENVDKRFNFTLDDIGLNAKQDIGNFEVYVGVCLNKNNVINYIIFQIKGIVNLYYQQKEIAHKWCVDESYFKYHSSDLSFYENKCNDTAFFNDELCSELLIPINSEEEEEDCNIKFNTYRVRAFNDEDKALAEELFRSYCKEIFYLKLEETEKESIVIDENLEEQARFSTGQFFKNNTHDIIAQITDFGDIEIRNSSVDSNTYYYDKICLNELVPNDLYEEGMCKYDYECDERKSEYLMLDKDSVSSCIKLQLYLAQKKNVQMVIYKDGSMAIKEGTGGGILFYTKPTIEGKGPFTIGVSNNYELLIIDSEGVVVWMSTSVLIHDPSKFDEYVDPLIP